MAPLEDKLDTQEQLDAEHLINGPLSAQTTITTASWTSNSEDYKQMILQEAQGGNQQREAETAPTASSGSNENLQLSSGNAHKSRNYGACEQIVLDRSDSQGRNQLDLSSKSFKLDDQLDRKLVESSRIDKSRQSSKVVNKGREPQQGNGNGDGASESGDDGAASVSTTDKKTVLERAAKVIPGLGIILALCASFSLGTAGMLVKMTHSVNGIQVAVLRSLIQLIIYSFIISFRRLTILPERGEWIPVFGRAMLGATSMCFTYYALNLIPLGDATAIRFSLPIWTLIVSYFFLKESCHLTKVLAVFVAVLGVVLIAKPDDCIYLVHIVLRSFGYESAKEFKIHEHEHEEAREHELESVILMDDNQFLSAERTVEFNSTTGEMIVLSKNYNHQIFDSEELARRHLEGCLLALASSILLALSLIALRMAKKTPAEVTIFWLSVLSIVIGNCLLFGLNEWSLPNNLTDVLYILLNGLCGSAGQWFITSALKIEQSGIIALARTFDIEVAFLYSALLLRENIRTTR